MNRDLDDVPAGHDDRRAAAGLRVRRLRDRERALGREPGGRAGQRRVAEDERQAVGGRSGRDLEVGEAIRRQVPVCGVTTQAVAAEADGTSRRRRGRGRRWSPRPGGGAVGQGRAGSARSSASRRGGRTAGGGGQGDHGRAWRRRWTRRRVAWVMRSSGDSGRCGRRRRSGRAPSHRASCRGARRPMPL